MSEELFRPEMVATALSQMADMLGDRKSVRDAIRAQDDLPVHVQDQMLAAFDALRGA